jgi:hypothetical protein
MLALPIMVLVVASGCDRAATFKAKLGEDEKVASKSPVFIDDTEAGYVKDLKIEAGERVAVLALTDKQVAQERIRAGIFRVVGEDGRIVLRTDGMKPDAAPLPAGAYIPSKSKAQYAVEKFTSARTLAVVVIAGAVVLLLLICLKSATHFVVLSLALVLAGVSAWAFHPYLVPEIQTLYQSMPTTSKAEANTANQPSAAKSTSGLATVENNFVDVLNNRPDPRVLAFAATFTFGFLLYALLLRRAIRALKWREC